METHIGEFDLYENEIVPLDLPMLEEQMDIEDEIANEEFGMDYDQLGSNEKEWVRDEIDNMSMSEAYSGFRRGEPEDPDTIPFNPTKSVSEFKEDLRALFGKFKSDLNNPEFIQGVAQVMVSWKSLLRSQLSEVKIGDIVKIDAAYGGGKGEVESKVGSFVVINGESYQ